MSLPTSKVMSPLSFKLLSEDPSNYPDAPTGERFAFITTKGLKDVCAIGDQARPELFNLKIRKPKLLHSAVVEVNERIVPADYDLNPTP
ncbi:hypothetical protein MY11210_003703 [Beauveria gryllotalpidicola]